MTGDTMFINGCGRADLGDSSPQALYQSLEKIKQLPDTTGLRNEVILQESHTALLYAQTHLLHV